ncbi:cadherin repeat domain-containing protein, partial [Oceanobacter sp. 5_MG-2023]|uniref:beta strand repeat-containing protein n=1 Tax=Oceanobacter sp. 5_MG-2023 TaxID=3062645 RepID=UPI0026E2C463
YYAYAVDSAGNLSLASSEWITLVDEMAPTFTSGTTATAIDENSGASTVIYTATTDDATAVYSLSGTDASDFSIDSSTGVVTLLNNPDYETKSSYSFIVTATDGAGNHTDQAVTLDVNDLDDTAPEASIVLSLATVQLEALGNTSDSDYAPQITAVGSAGAYVVTWYGYEGAGYSGDRSIFVQAFNADGSLNGATVQLEAPGNTDGDDYVPQITAVGTDGAYVVTWYGEDSDGDWSIFVQAFKANGSFNGVTVQLEALGNTNGYDVDPQITAVGSDGAYVVTWQGYDSNNDYSIFVQAFKADGSINGTKVQLEALDTTTGDDYSPQITAVGTDGDYVVTWYGEDSNNDYSIFVQAFKADGSFNGTTVQLEALGNTTGYDRNPQITAVGTDGAYVVTWYGRDSDGDWSIFVQAFNAVGSLNGTTVQLEALDNITGDDYLPQITAVGTDGAYVVTWSGEDSDGDWSIFVQAFNAYGSFNGDTVQLEALGKTNGDDESPQITAVGTDGAYVVTWYGDDSDGDTSIFVQAFNADGSVNGDTVQLEALGKTSGYDGYPQITAVGSDGAYVVTWYGADSDGDYSIFVQAFNADGTLVMDSSTYETGELVTLQSNEAGTVYLVSDTVAVTTEADITSASSNLWATATLAVAGTVTVDTTTLALGGYYAYAVDSAGNLSLASSEWITLVDETAPTFTSGTTATAIDENSGESTVIYTATTDDATAVYSLSGTDASDFSIDSSTGVVTLLNNPDYETKSSYSFIVTATDGAGNHTDQAVTLDVNDLDDTDPEASIVLSLATAQLEALGNTTSGDFAPQITAVGSDGAYVVTWSGDDSDGDYSIFVQAFNADGSFNSTTVQLEALNNTTGHDYDPQITAVGTDGAYVVTWSGRDSGGDYSVFVQAFDADGSFNSTTVQLEARGNTTGYDYFPQITAVGTDGAYVVTWYGLDSNGDLSIFVQAFKADDSFNGTTIQLEALDNITGADRYPQITAVGTDGVYVVTWRGDDSDGDYSIFVQAFKADGSFNGDKVQLEALGNTTGRDYDPQIIAVGSDGAYVATWYGVDSNNDYSIFVQAFDADGSLNGATIQLETLGGYDVDPQITAVGTDGAYVVTWYGEDSDGDYSIFVQAFNANG